MSHPSDNPQVGLFVTCLVDLFRPNVGFSAVELLEQAGCQVSVPPTQTCCGQPAYNSGDRADTKDIATQVIKAFDRFDYVVAPSGSCAGMIKKHYPSLFEEGDPLRAKAEALSAKTFELISFLVDVRGVSNISSKLDSKINEIYISFIYASDVSNINSNLHCYVKLILN